MLMFNNETLVCNLSSAAAVYIDGLVQDCSNSRVLAMELLQSCTKPSISNYAINFLIDKNNIIFVTILGEKKS